MPNSFGYHFKQFALSIDFVRNETLDEVKKIVEKYFQEKLYIILIEHLKECKVNHDTGLCVSWVNIKEKSKSNSIYKDGKIYNQTAFAYIVRKPLWIINPDKGILADTDHYIDLWSNQISIPKYESYTPYCEQTIKTSIIYPIIDNEERITILNLESDKYLEISTSIKNEIRLIAEGLEILFNLNNLYMKTKENTKSAIENLKLHYESAPSLIYKKPKVFLASSGRADNLVIGHIKQTFDEVIKDKAELIFWEDMSNNGKVISQIETVISECIYGICYFSEPSDHNTYNDNLNVIFEAGMLHSLCISTLTYKKEWLPIHEKSGKIPFDFAAERILFVPRNQNNVLNVPLFKSDLAIMLQNNVLSKL